VAVQGLVYTSIHPLFSIYLDSSNQFVQLELQQQTSFEMSKTIEAQLASEVSEAFSAVARHFGYVHYSSTYCERYNPSKGGWTPYYRFQAYQRNLGISANEVAALLRTAIAFYENPNHPRARQRLDEQRYKFEVRIGEKKRKFFTPHEALEYLQSHR